MSPEERAKVIAERVARRLAGAEPSQSLGNRTSHEDASTAADLPRARMIDFISSGPPLRAAPSVATPARSADASPLSSAPSEFFQFVPATQSPWLGRLPAMLSDHNSQSELPNPQSVSHPSEERFGVEEATVKELVEFFESEKKCSVEPGGKPCDHCAMCSSRGF